MKGAMNLTYLSHRPDISAYEFTLKWILLRFLKGQIIGYGMKCVIIFFNAHVTTKDNHGECR